MATLDTDPAVPTEIDSLAAEVMSRARNPKTVVAELNAAIAKEADARQAFVDGLSPEVKGEWVRGRPVYHSPARHAHNAAVSALLSLLTDYRRGGGAITVTVEKQMIELDRSNYEPDVAVWLNETHIPDPEQVVYPPCDLIIEVLSKRTRKLDRGDKYSEYAEGGIPEYWIVDAEARTIERYSNDGGVYAASGISRVGDQLSSLVLDGFSFEVAAVFDFAIQDREGRRLMGGA